MDTSQAPQSSHPHAHQTGPGKRPARRGLDYEGPACPYCSLDVDDLAVHILDYCRETFPNRQYPDSARFQDIAVWPLGLLSEADQQRRLADLARVHTATRLLPKDTEPNRRRRIAYQRELAKLLEVKGVAAGDSQTGGIVFLKEEA